MILFLYGEDTFRSRRYVDQSIEKFKRERDPQGYNVIKLDAEKIEPSRIFAEIASAPFLAAKRMIVVDNILSVSDKEFLAALQEKLQASRIPESNVVIFIQTETPSKTKEAKALFEVLKKEPFAQEFAAPTPDKLQAWIKKELADRQIAIAPDAAAYLAQHSGGDVWFLNGVLAQVAAYAAGRTIVLADAKLFMGEKLDGTVFTMIEAFVAGRREFGIRLLYELRQQGQDDFQIFNLLVWQFRSLLSIADLVEREPGVPADVIAGRTGLHPFVVKKSLGVVQRYNVATLRKLYEELHAIDFKTKTGLADQALLIDAFVGKI